MFLEEYIKSEERIMADIDAIYNSASKKPKINNEKWSTTVLSPDKKIEVSEKEITIYGEYNKCDVYTIDEAREYFNKLKRALNQHSKITGKN